MTRLRVGTSLVCTLALVGLAACSTEAKDSSASSSPQAAPTQPRSTATSGGTVRLARGAHPLAQPQYDRGRLDHERRIDNLSLYFRPTASQVAARDALAAAQLDPKSPLYRAWLTPEQYAARFGASSSDVARASAWLVQQGFVVQGSSRLGTRVSFSAKVGELEAAFQTEMHRYEVGGEMHYAMATAPAIPAELASLVLGVRHTHDFFARPVSRAIDRTAFERRGQAAPRYAEPQDGGPPFDVLGPGDWATAYDVARLYSPGIGNKPLDGTGVTIGVVGTAQIAATDVASFRSTFGLPPAMLKMTLVPNTGAAIAGQYGNGVEAILDVEWSGGIAKGATVNYVFVGENDFDVDDATLYIIEENLASVISESYGGCEAGTPPSDADITMINGTAANLMGITYMAAAGDDGAADCIEEGFSGLYVDMPGAFPGVTSVGGTQFPVVEWSAAGNLESYPTSEAVWNESDNPLGSFGVGAGGGGISIVFSRPEYQAGISTCPVVGTLPVAENTASMRQVPDVAVSAASGTPGYYIPCTFDPNTGDCSGTGGSPMGTPIGGTSASAPSFSGFVAILSGAVGERLGNINPMLYQLAAKTSSTPPFHDITAGNNEVVCAASASDAGSPDGGWPDAGCSADGLYGYAAAPGYDCASGLGSIDGYNIVNAWIGLARTTTTIAATPNPTTEAGEVTLTATVNVPGTSASVLGGDVTFEFQSYTTSGAIDLAWELGTVPVSGASASGGTATLKTVVPPGLVKPGSQWVDVVATYGGDLNHVASQSPKLGLGFAPLSFAIVPATATVPVNGTKGFSTTGGTAPINWFIEIDTTATFNGQSNIEPDGGFTAGPQAGYVLIGALDDNGAEQLAEVTVGAATGPAPWDMDGGSFNIGVPPVDASAAKDAGPADSGAALVDSGHAVQGTTPPAQDTDAAAEPTPAGSSHGRGCSVDPNGGGPDAPLGSMGLLIALGLVCRPRRG